MMKRVLTALVAGSLAVAGALLLDSPWVFWVSLLLLTGCAFEYSAICRRVQPDFPRPLLIVAVPLVALAWLLPASSSPPALPFLLLAFAPLAFAVLLLAAPTPKSGAVSLAWASFGLPYLVLPIWALYELHRLHPRLLVVFLLSVWVNDSMALMVGSAWGRHKLAPRLSPNKTWEGAIGGIVGSAAVGGGGLYWLGAEPFWPLLSILLA